jgi:UDP-glucose:(heptosyl)LPS alpha-1,3-glucosyltransferase
MNIAFCYESVLPSRGGCETYIASLARRLVADGHDVHLYARCWDETALPAGLHYHHVDAPGFPRFLRPWYFSSACRRKMRGADHEVSIGFDKIAGPDVLYPQGGVYAASVDFNLLKHPRPLVRRLLRSLKWLDPAHLSFLALEREQFRPGRALLVAISGMVQRHMEEWHGAPPEDVRVLPVAPPPDRFDETDRPRRRHEARQRWDLSAERVVALFAGMNYRLKGLEPLLHALALLDAPSLSLVVAGRSATGSFQRLARRLGVGDRVHFVGYCADMRDAYFAADLLVHPTFYDPCANVVLEALACGLPVITTRNNGASELLRPVGDGGRCAEGLVLGDPHDHEKLACCIGEMLDPLKRLECARAARQNAASWTFEHHYRGMLAILAEAAARKAREASEERGQATG